MRLWHYKIIPYLPKSQLLAQWRELNSIFKKRDHHILINYVYDYDKSDLLSYTLIVLNEFVSRKYKINSFDNLYQYFGNEIYFYKECPFRFHHNLEYFEICFYNLKEKYIRGQKDFTSESFEKLVNFKKNECSLSLKNKDRID